MFKHPDTCDPVKFFIQIAVIHKTEFDWQVFIVLSCIINLFFRNRDPAAFHSIIFSGKSYQTSLSTADIKKAHPRFELKFLAD